MSEQLAYIMCGVATTLVNWLAFCLLSPLIGAVPANAASWCAAVLFAFVANKVWVFGKRDFSPASVLRELALFIGARLLSGVFEIGGLALLMRLNLGGTLWGVEGAVAKAVISVVVVVLNYFFSKFVIFRKRGSKE
ncbi:MAG: GtrA family protein [Synergistaceae bacterium]|jgi:putative flippase GtrA|nr:GtrA family protein [Synergistaceae bacterium]